METPKDFTAANQKITNALIETTKTVNKLADQDLKFQRAVDPLIASQLDDQNESLLKLSNGLLKSAGLATKQRVIDLEDADDIDISWRGIVDVIDSLLEKADTCLDEYTGLLKRKDAPTSEQNAEPKRSKFTNTPLDWSLKRANIIKPQNAFERKADNCIDDPWRPLLTKKPHAKVDLESSLTTFVDENQNEQYKHPYESEITELEYPAAVYQKRPPIPYLPVEGTSAVWVDTYEGVLEMLEELKQASEIAVDLEHHDYRSYAGLLSLMQISTRDRDWIVDTLRPWRHRLEVLNEVFADPSIVKVFHGAYMDIIWLQRDLGLYIVGLFDTYFASEALALPAKSLAFLLKRFVGFEADKRYQLADWRIRPLPQEMLYYARSDTHYLLYMYDRLRNDLIEQSDPNAPGDNMVAWVTQKSKEVSLQRYEHPITDPETGPAARAWFNFLVKTPQISTAEQLSVYKAVYQWRDSLARKEDENPIFFMSQTVLADISKFMPDDAKALWSLMGAQARVLKQYLDELLQLVQDAKARGAGGPTVAEVLRAGTDGVGARKGYGRQGTRQLNASPSVSAPQDVQSGLPSIDELRYSRSQLFGGVAMSTVHDGTSRADEHTNSKFAVPWLEYVQNTRTTEHLAEENETEETHSQPEQVPESPSRARGTPEDDNFTLKTGRKRKAEAGSATSPSSRNDSDLDVYGDGGGDGGTQSSDGAKHGRNGLADSGTHPDPNVMDDSSPMTSKERRRAARKERKRQKAETKRKQADQQEVSIHSAVSDDEPFDYSAASSVLHAQRTGTKEAKETKRTKVFDPYSKMTDGAPRPAKQLVYEKSGKTATFKK